MRADIGFYQARRTGNGLIIVGVDPAEPAIAYATATGLIDDGAAPSPEWDALISDAACAMLSGLDLIFSPV